jgi:hypothetical protein
MLKRRKVPNMESLLLVKLLKKLFRMCLKKFILLTAVWGMFEDFTNNSTVHGVKYLGEKKRHWSERAFWVLKNSLNFIREFLCLKFSFFSKKGHSFRDISFWMYNFDYKNLGEMANLACDRKFC